MAESIVYGSDDRVEVYAADPVTRATVAGSLVALVPTEDAAFTGNAFAASVPSLGASLDLCPGEAFADQPATAFCSGVLVDDNLVLTAGHCASLLPLDSFVVVLDYYYQAPGVLAVQPADVRKPLAILSEEVDPSGAEPRLDYAWLRIDGAAGHPEQPVAIRGATPPLEDGEAIVSASTPEGVPVKIDEDGRIADPREDSMDYFVASTDTSAGSSGSPAFDDGGAVVGILRGGGLDYIETDAGCQATNVVPDGGPAMEEFTYASAALQGLCRDEPSATSLCRPDCGNPCAASASDGQAWSSGCSTAPGERRGAIPVVAVLAIASLVAGGRDRRRGRR